MYVLYPYVITTLLLLLLCDGLLDFELGNVLYPYVITTLLLLLCDGLLDFELGKGMGDFAMQVVEEPVFSMRY